MKYFNVSLILLMLLSCTACRENKAGNERTEILEITGRTPADMLLSEITTGMEVIKLETVDSCLLGGISHFRISDRFIYIKDIHFEGIYEFDREGRCVKILHKRGRGPGEYIEISDFIIDEEQNTLEIFDMQTKKLYIYRLSDFSFIKEIPVPLTVAFKVAKNGDMYYFNTKGLRNIVNGQPTNSHIITYHQVSGQLLPLFDRILPDEEHQSWDFVNGFAFNSQNDLFFSMAWQNRCYKIEDTSIKPVLLIDVGSQDVPDRIKNGTYDQKMQYINSSLSKDKFLFIRLLMYEANTFIVSCEKGYAPSQLYYYIRSGDRDYYTDKIVNDFIPFQPDLDMHYIFAEKEFLIYLLMPDENQPSQVKQQLVYFDVATEDNPVIVLFRIKK